MKLALDSQGISAAAWLFIMAATVASGQELMLTALVAVALLGVALAVHPRRITVSVAVPLAIISFVVILAVVTQMLTGIRMWMSWPFIVVLLGATFVGYRGSRRLESQARANAADCRSGKA